VLLTLVLASACAGRRGWFTVPDPSPIALEPHAACPQLNGKGPIVVLVHGIGGETANVGAVEQVLKELEPAAMLSFHWSPMEATEPLVARLAAGLTDLERCANDERPVLVLAHSAGGVLSALAVGQLPPVHGTHDLVLVTVASPLAGAGYTSWRVKLLPVKPFAVTVGGKFEQYPAPDPGVRVVHVRTHPAGDQMMRQTSSGHLPDDPRAVIPGATERSLPVHVGHDDALLWAARALVEAPESFGLRN